MINTIVFEFLFFLAILVIVYVDSYTLKCPSHNSWKIRAKLMCKSTLKYFCLYNNVVGEYVEGCNGPDWDRKGSKRIFANSFTRGKCIQNRYQPFNFQTNGSMSDCIYDKSHCNEEGQVIYKAGSSKVDRTCRCDYTKSYAFLKNQKHVCFCIPTEEDCSCYVKSCPVNLSLSTDYSCTKNGIKQNQMCTEITKFAKTLFDNEGPNQISLASNFKWGYTTNTIILVLLCIVTILVAGGFCLAVSLPDWTCKKLQLLARIFRRNYAAGEVRLNEGEHQPERNSVLTIDEVNFLRMIHLLVRVACPVVRMYFDTEIQPDQLRKTLDKYRSEMVTRYRKNDTIINDFQWRLLYEPYIGQTVTSNDFDIRLMTYLLGTLANIKVGDLYPVYSDTSIRAMLSRIQFISNETLRNFQGQLSGYKFNKNWDCIGQAVLKLASSFKLDTKNDEEKTRLIDRLLVLNRKNIDTRSLRIFIYMSESCPGLILQQLLSEYCASKSTTIEEILRKEKHTLYHKRIKNVPCCICPSDSIYYRFIPEQQWKLLYSKLEGGYSHTCQSGGKPCIERFVPKMMTTWNVSVSKTLILNIPDILTYMISRLNISEFDQFLLHYQHVLYHSMEGKMCCKCQKVPSNKIIIDEEEWNILFKKENDMSCHHGIKNCCCQYSVRNGINFTDIEGIYLSKIFTVAGPIGELNKIEQDALLYFLHWTRDDKPLQKALLDLSNMIDDKLFCINISSLIPNQSTETKLKQLEAHGWIDSHLPKQKATTEPQLQILIRDEDGLNARSVLIPDDFSLPCRTTKFKDLTTEENNYLVVVYGLTKIVYPVIRNEFKSQCPSHVLEEIRFSIFDKVMNANNSRDAKNGAIDKIHNTPDLQEQLSPRPKLKNPDFELMITILKIRSNTDWNKRYIDNLDVIENIRREIIQSNSGILDQTRFHNILNRISKAVLHLGGEKFKDELSRLHHIRNILGTVNMEPKITLYENKNFRGRSQEITESCPNLLDFGFNNITSSVKCDRGVWILYKRKNYEGKIFVIQEGDVYNKLSKYFNNRASSVKLICDYDFTEEPECIVYENNFSGRSLTFIDDVENLKWYKFDNRMSSIVVKSGAWVGYRYPNYDGEQSLFLKGKYTASVKASDEGGFKNDRISSFSKIMVQPSPEGNMRLLQLDYDLDKANIVRTPTSVFSWTQVNNTSVEQTVTKTDEVTIQREDTYEFRWDRAAKVSCKLCLIKCISQNHKVI